MRIRVWFRPYAEPRAEPRVFWAESIDSAFAKATAAGIKEPRAYHWEKV